MADGRISGSLPSPRHMVMGRTVQFGSIIYHDESGVTLYSKAA